MALRYCSASRSRAIAPSMTTLAVLETALSSLRISPPSLLSLAVTSKRHATHQAQGRANGASDGAGKRLGAKKTGGEYVVPGNILFKQRGTLWFPGDNCSMGRDHTIHASQPGYVRYYRDPLRHPKRQYIGVVFEKDQTLPQPPNAVRRRKLGMLAYQMPSHTQEQQSGGLVPGSDTSLPGNADMGSGQPSTIRDQPSSFRGQTAIKNKQTGAAEGVKLTLRPGYQYRQANWEIGRAAEQSKKAQKVQPFKPGDRFAAWRKTTASKARNAVKRAMRRGGKKR